VEALFDGIGVELDVLHVGDEAPELGDAGRLVRTVAGPVIETLLEEAAAVRLIAMPTAGRQGFREALRGSTTERVIREASCPVLAIPVSGIPVGEDRPLVQDGTQRPAQD
jgi:nucleotide-binding universal stress UspA family protein